MTSLAQLQEEQSKLSNKLTEFADVKMTEKYIKVPRPRQHPQTTKLVGKIKRTLLELDSQVAEDALTRAEIVYELLDELHELYKPERMLCAQAIGEHLTEVLLPLR